MNIKKTIALFVSVILILSSSFISVSAEEIQSYSISEWEYKLSKLYAVSLMSDETVVSDDDLKNQLYSLFFDAIYNGETRIYLDEYNLYIQNYRELIEQVVWESMPEAFRTVSRITFWKCESGLIPYIDFEYHLDAESFRDKYNMFVKAADNMTSDLKTNKLTDVQKALILHDRIIAKCEYDTAAADELNAFKEANAGNPDAVMPWEAAFTAYGAIVEGSAVCQGYTEAYEYLLKQVGIESVRCESDLLNHIWNILFIDGKSYHVDVTWDDPVWKDKNGNIIHKLDYIAHNNFMLSSMGIYNSGHNIEGYIDYDFTPNDETYDNYFWKSCHHETFLIGSGLYHFNDYDELCEYDCYDSLTTVGLADVDGDKKINSIDISYFRHFIIGSRQPSGNQFTACDITKDGDLNLSDLVRMKKILLYIQ